jgi:hypothetical protein
MSALTPVNMNENGARVTQYSLNLQKIRFACFFFWPCIEPTSYGRRPYPIS